MEQRDWTKAQGQRRVTMPLNRCYSEEMEELALDPLLHTGPHQGLVGGLVWAQLC